MANHQGKTGAPIVMLITGLAFAVAGFGLFYSEYPKGDHIVSTQGKLVNVSGSRKPNTYSADFSFKHNGQTYIQSTSTQSSFYRNGKKVTVLYDESNPDNAALLGDLVFAFIFFAIGALLIIAFIYICYKNYIALHKKESEPYELM